MTVRTRGLRTARDGSRDNPRRNSHRAAGSATDKKGPSSKGANLILLIIAIVGSLHVISMLGLESWRAVTSKSEIARLEGDIALLEREHAGLQAVVDHADDQLYREHLARCRGFVYPDEVRFITMIEGNEPVIPAQPKCN